jgi:energy-coupling factor transport system permease protein
MNQQRIVGFKPGTGFLYDLSGASKLLFFILVSIACMVSYDTRLIAGVGLGSLLLFKIAKIRWADVSFVIYFIFVFALLNVLMVHLFAPHYGDQLYGSSTVVWDGPGPYDLTTQQVFYLFNLSIKYICTVPLAVIFLMTTHPSQFAASLNQIGLPYKIAYAVSLTLRYIPDVQEDYQTIKLSQEARGLELSKKAKLLERIKGNLQILTPLIFSSLDRIDTISTAMELRRFGRNNKRTWYMYRPLKKLDYVVLAFAVLIVLLTLALFWINQGRFYNPWR